jgi:hypothetical protein
MGYNSPLIQMGKALKYSKMKYLWVKAKIEQMPIRQTL